MLELIPPGFRVDFMSKAKPGVALSVLMILVGLGSFGNRSGLGLDIRRPQDAWGRCVPRRHSPIARLHRRLHQ